MYNVNINGGIYMKFKNILLTSAIASLSLIGLVSCDSDDSVKIEDASGNTITIKKNR